MHLLGHEVGDEGDDDRHGAGGGHVPNGSARRACQPADDVADGDGEDRPDEEVEEDVAEFALPVEGSDGRGEDDDGDGVVEETFGLQRPHDSTRNLGRLGYRFDRDRIGRGDHGPQREGKGDFDARDEKEDDPRGRDGGHRGQDEGHDEQGTPATPEHRPGGTPGHREKQRRQEEREDDLRIDREPGKHGKEGQARDRQQQKDGIGKLGALPHHHCKDRHREETQDHDETGHERTPFPSVNIDSPTRRFGTDRGAVALLDYPP